MAQKLILYYSKFFNMADNLKKTGPQDSSRINIHEKHELQYWTETLAISKEELMEAVKKVGTSAEAVKKA